MRHPAKFDHWSCRLLAGLQAGMLGGLLLSAYFWLESLLFARSVWQAPRLFAAALLGPGGAHPHFDFSTVIGYSVLLLCCGAMGLLFAVLVPPATAGIWALNAGIAYSLVWYLVVMRELLVSPIGGMPSGFTMLGYFLFGALLTLYGRYYRRIAQPLRLADSASPNAPDPAPCARRN